MKKYNFLLAFVLNLVSFLTYSQTIVTMSNGTVNSCNGILFDTGNQGGTGYSNNENLTLTICADVPGNAINMIFNHFNLSPTNTATLPANNKDNLTIYDGNSVAAPTLGTYSENDLQSLIVSATSANISGCLTFVFNSNNAGTGVFSATITCATPCQPPTALYTSPSVVQNPQLICQGETVTFDASGSTASPTFTLANYIFDYGDGVIDTIQTPYSTHAFENPGQYLVNLTVVDNNNCFNMNSEIIKVWVSTTPNFNTIISDPIICLGESSCLDGESGLTTVTYTPTPTSSLAEATYLPDNVGQCFTATLDYELFMPGQTLNDITDLIGICVNIEHSYMADLVATITCPNGTSVVLHQQNGLNTNLGDPNQADDSLLIGIGWNYCWSPTATNGAWEANAQYGTTPNTIINSSGSQSLTSETYESLNSLTPLVGCPLNGIWEIEFCDLWSSDDGFIFDFWLDLEPSLYPSLTSFTPSIGLLSDSTYWISNTSGNMSLITYGAPDSNEICITPTDVGIFDYTYVVNDNFGCKYDTTVSILVFPNFTYTKNQSDSLVCLGEDVIFTINPTSVLPITYYWEPANIFNDATLASPTATILTPGKTTITVRMNNGAQCIKSDTFEVYGSNVAKPTINIVPNDTTLSCGDPLNLTVNLVEGIPKLCGLSPNNNCSQSTTQTTIGTGNTSISSVPSPYSGFYHDGRVQMMYTAAELNAMGFIGGKISEIGFNITNKASTAPYNGLTIKMGCTTTNNFSGATQFEPDLFQVKNSASYTSTIGWNTHILDNAYEWDGTSNLIVEVCFDNSTYTATDRVAQTSTTQSLTIRAYQNGSLNSGCNLNGADASFSTDLNRPNIRLTYCTSLPNPADYIFLWTPTAMLSDPSSQNPIASPTASTNYIVTVSDLSGLCSSSDTISVTANAMYTAIFDSTDASCYGGNDGKVVVKITGNAAPYTINYFDSLSNTLIQTNNTNANDSISTLSVGAYIVKITDNTGCQLWKTIHINEPSQVVITNLTQNSTICIDGRVVLEGNFSGGAGAGNIIWDHNLIGNGPHSVIPSDSLTIYYVYGKDSIGCISKTDSIVVLWHDSLRVTDLLSDTLCQDSAFNSTLLTAIVTGGDVNGYTYQWFDGTNTLIDTNNILNASPSTSPENFTLIVSDGCTTPTASTNVDIYILPKFEPIFKTITGDRCDPDTVEFINLTGIENIFSVEWNFGDNSISTQPLNTTHIYNKPGVYDINLKVTNLAGCIEDTTYTAYVIVNALPVADFKYSPLNPITFDTEITFENLSSNYISSYWIFSEGNPSTSTEDNIIVTFPNEYPGTYPTQLIVKSDSGCVASTAGRFVQINGVYLLYIPNAFTPNDDGKNDIFRAFGYDLELTEFTMAIYNRWGELLFKTNNIDNGWDGTSNGKKTPAGTYVWKINAKEKHTPITHNNWGEIILKR
jgi:gliding motility-associated-like protein